MAEVAQIGVRMRGDSRLELVAVAEYGELFRAVEAEPGGTWSGWQPVQTGVHDYRRISLVSLGDSRLMLAATTGTDHTVVCFEQTPDYSWPPPQSLGAPFEHPDFYLTPVLVTGPSGEIILFVGANDGNTTHVEFLERPLDQDWSLWNRIINPAIGENGLIGAFAARNAALGAADIHLIASFDIDRSTMVHLWQEEPHHSWSEWDPVGGGPVPADVIPVQPVLAPDLRVLHLFASADGTLFHCRQVSEDPRAWSTWERFGTAIGSPTAVFGEQANCLVVIGAGNGPTGEYGLWERRQVAEPGTGWHQWRRIDSGYRPYEQLAVINDARGDLQLFGVSRGRICHFRRPPQGDWAFTGEWPQPWAAVGSIPGGTG
jgi:hypothetical protein